MTRLPFTVALGVGVGRLAVWMGVVSVLATLTLGAASAGAALQYPLVEQLANGLAQPNGPVTVDGKTGGTLVADTEQTSASSLSVVRVFDTSGGLTATWTGSNTPGGSFGERVITSVAANDSTGDVYVVDQTLTHSFVDVFEASGAYVGQITGAGAPAGVFGNEVRAVTVDQATGDVYVSDTAHEVVDVFTSTGSYLAQITGASTPSGSFSEVNSMAVDDVSGDLLLADSGGVVYVFEAATGAYLETWDGSAASNAPGTPAGSFGGGSVAVAANNGTGEVYVADANDRVVDQLDSTGAYLGQITGVPGGASLEAPQGVAVEQATGYVYVLDTAAQAIDVFAGTQVVVPDVATGSLSNITATGATLNGTVNPDGIQVTGCRFEFGATISYGQTAACVETVGAGSGEVQVHADVANLTPGTTYHFRLLASNENGSNYGSDMEVTTLPVPVIENAQASAVTASSAVLTAKVNPDGLPLTVCEFEYGADASYGQAVPCAQTDVQIGAGSEPVPVSAAIAGLRPNTTYHWTLVVSNANGTSARVDHTFVYDTSGAGLPDGRAYEMVTPVQKNGASIGGYQLGFAAEFSEVGSRAIVGSIQCFAEAGSCAAKKRTAFVGSPYEMARTAGGWVTRALAPSATPTADSNATVLLNADTGSALFAMPAPPGGQYDFFAHGLDGSLLDIGPLTPPSAGDLGFTSDFFGGIHATANLSTVVYRLSPLSRDGRWPFDSTDPDLVGFQSLYEYTGTANNEPELVGVTGGHGSDTLISQCGTRLGGGVSGGVAGPNALSADGRTVYFSPETGNAERSACSGPAVWELYARLDGSETVRVSGRSPTDCTGTCSTSTPSGARFEGASEDGARAFFTSTQQLTNAARQDPNGHDAAIQIGTPSCEETVGANGCNLYLYDRTQTAGHNLIAVSAGDTSGVGPEVRGVVAISADGSRVYFVAKGVLTSAPNAGGQQAEREADNLYVYERDAAQPQGHVAFIATMSAADEEEWRMADLLVDVTHDGRFLVFTSHRALTPDATRRDGPAQVYRYDAVTGALLRVSIGQAGFNDNGNAAVADTTIVTPAETELMMSRAGSLRTDPTMSHDGSYIFFTSPLALTPHALDDVQISSDEHGTKYAQNVYEWEAEGIGSCGESGGCVSLISDGRDLAEVGGGSAVSLSGSDASGANVFFATTDRLVPQDTDTQLDVYDARVGGGFPAAASPTSCESGGCRGAQNAAPSFESLATVTFSGAGNLAAPVSAARPRVKARTRAGRLAGALRVCRARPGRHRRRVCEKSARKRYGSKSRTASDRRGAKS